MPIISSKRTLVIGILTILMFVALDTNPAFFASVHALTTTVCSSASAAFSHGPGSDIIGFIKLGTCGTLTAGAVQFGSTLHNVTEYCIDLASDTTVGCGQDFVLLRWDLILLGQNDTVIKYFYENTTAVAIDQLSSVRSFSRTVDFTQSYYTATIKDLRRGNNITRIGNTFVGTSNSFEIDWADYNNDGVVNRTDTSAAQAAFGSSDTYWDFNRDGIVDIVDVAIVGSHYGRSFGIAHFPSMGFALKTIDPQWKNSCSVFPDPDKTYCNTF